MAGDDTITTPRIDPRIVYTLKEMAELCKCDTRTIQIRFRWGEWSPRV